MDNLRFYIATYNVGTSTPDQDLHELLTLTHNPKNDKLPDFYVVSLQEVKAQPQSMLMAALFDDPWTNALREILQDRNYIKLKTIRLQGLILNIFCLRKHLLNIREMESDYTRTGLSGMWGNKGAVSTRLSIYGCTICFVNSHLSAHENMLKDRIEDYNSIIDDHKFHVADHAKIFYHDYVFWMGDLNFRLLEECDKSFEEIKDMIKKKEIAKLLECDELQAVMRSGDAFSELVEKPPTFPPTFKYDVGTSEYDDKRKPAWTDRILYKVNSKNYENVTLTIDQHSYEAHECYVLSDHKPVTAEFTIKIPLKALLDSSVTDPQVFADYAERIVQFENIEPWYLDEENSATYKITQEIPKTKDDWIGVFKDTFSSIDDYIIYEYISKGSSPTPTHKNVQGSTHHKKYSISFPVLPNRLTGMFRLIYISQSEDTVQSILGISEPFAVREKESE